MQLGKKKRLEGEGDAIAKRNISGEKNINKFARPMCSAHTTRCQGDRLSLLDDEFLRSEKLS